MSRSKNAARLSNFFLKKKKKTTDEKYDIGYELSFRVACRKFEEARLQSA